MAKRPYGEPVSHQQKASTSSGWASLLWMFMGAVIAVMIGIFLYLSPLFDSFKTDVEANPPAQVQPLAQSPQESSDNYEFYEVLPKRDFQTGSSAMGESPAESSNAQTVESTKVKPDVVVKAPAQSSDSTDTAQVTVVEENDTYDGENVAIKSVNQRDNATTNSTESSYILQVRSYDNSEDANRMRAEVMMSGVDARIIVRMDNDVEIHQVISNTMNAEEVKNASQRLKARGIDFLIVEQRR